MALSTWAGAVVADAQMAAADSPCFSCGDFAAMVEDRCSLIGPRSVLSEVVCPERVTRVHAEVDASNGCFDHVAWVFRNDYGTQVMDAYVYQRGPGVRTVDPGWFGDVVVGLPAQGSNAVRLTRSWRELFAVPDAPSFVGPIANVSVHVSVWDPTPPFSAVV